MDMLWIFFFFSSRRRHTRCGRDWSSDVCSSDLDGQYQKYVVEPGTYIREHFFGKSPELAELFVGKMLHHRRQLGTLAEKMLANVRSRLDDVHSRAFFRQESRAG